MDRPDGGPYVLRVRIRRGVKEFMVEEHPQRRLAAVLAADVVGYSKLMSEDEEGTLASLDAHLADHILPCIAKHRGRVVKTMGDGLIAEFASVVDSVRCGLAFQSGMDVRNRGAADGRLIEFRLGINLGDVIVQGDDIFGEGVNIAARLEALCDPRSVFVSGTAYDQVVDKLQAEFDDLGEHAVKNIARPVRVFRVRAGDGPRDLQRPSSSDGAAPADALRALAVLPFINMSGDPEQEYFVDGLTGDLITALARWRHVPVISRNSCFVYKGKAIDLRQVSTELGVRYVLEGSVRKSGVRVRITAELIDGSRDHHVWADKFDLDLDDIFEVQDEIVQRISAIVVPELSKAELVRLTAEPRGALDAWDLCLQGKHQLRKNMADSNVSARALIQSCIDQYPDYADAHSGLAQSHNQDILLGVSADRSATAALAAEAASTAVRRDPTSSWAHHELATAYQWLNRLDEALEEARTAVDLNPNDAYALHAFGNKSDLAGDPLGIERMESAQKLNPEDAFRHTHLTYLARAYVAAGDYARALDRSRHAIRRSPTYAPAHYMSGIALARLGRAEEARLALDACENLQAGFVASRRGWRPYTDDARNSALTDGLAGLFP